MNAKELKNKILNLECELKQTRRQLEAISQPIPNRTPIKHKKKYGIVTGFHLDLGSGEQLVEFVYHNGMKPRHTFAPLDEIKIIPQESMRSFDEHVRRNGSLSTYLEE